MKYATIGFSDEYLTFPTTGIWMSDASSYTNLTRSAFQNYMVMRLNGDDNDCPNDPFPNDGTFDWEYWPGERETSRIIYTEGNKDKKWMKQRDINYLKRLKQENPNLFDQELGELKLNRPVVHRSITFLLGIKLSESDPKYDPKVNGVPSQIKLKMVGIGISDMSYTFPVSGMWNSDPGTHTKLCRSALNNYKVNRTNGDDRDEPDSLFPHDGSYHWEKPHNISKESRITYKEGKKDRKWMKERDQNYLFRLYEEKPDLFLDVLHVTPMQQGHSHKQTTVPTEFNSRRKESSRNQLHHSHVAYGVSSARNRFQQFLAACQHLIVDQKLTQPKCFISYCWGADDGVRQQLQKRLREFKGHLETLGATVYLDLTNLGTNINQFMEKIKECDFIFLIGTPELKARLEEAEENNLKKEFEHVKSRFSTKADCLLPLIFEANGDFSSAFKQTMPRVSFIKENMVRDCRQQGNEWFNPGILITYMDTLSGYAGQGLENESLGIIPTIYCMQNQREVMQRYEVLRQGLKDGLAVICEERPSTSPSLVDNRNGLFAPSPSTPLLEPVRSEVKDNKKSSSWCCFVM